MSEQSGANASAQDNHDTPELQTPRVLAEEALAIDPQISDQFLKDLANGYGGGGVAGQQKLYQSLGGLDRAALTLSGGGIRSAAFGLGVIQALATHPRPNRLRDLFEAAPAPNPILPAGEAEAEPKPGARATEPAAPGLEMKKPEMRAALERKNSVVEPQTSLLAQLHYLSTVSGGGYIGSWLSTWRYRASFEHVRNSLIGRPGGPDVEPHALGWLRGYSNYLTPKLGALSGDTWAGVAIWLRNLLLNWLIIIPAICAVILVLKMIATIAIGVAVLPPNDPSIFVAVVLALGLFGAALVFTTRNRPTRRIIDMRDKVGRPVGVTQGTFIRLDLVPVTLGVGAFIQLAASNLGLGLADHHSAAAVLAITAAAGAVFYALSWIMACPERRDWKDFWLWTLSGVIWGALLGIGVYAYGLAPTDGRLLFNDLLLPVMLGVPWLLISQMIAEMIFVGLDSHQGQDSRTSSRMTPTVIANG